MGPREQTSRSFLSQRMVVVVKKNERFFGGCSSKVECPVVNGSVAGAVPVSHPYTRNWSKHMKSNTLKIAVQKSGRLSDGSLEFLRKSGLDFESYTKRLLCRCRNFPLAILYVRDDDIAGYVASGVADIGILGQNLLYELRPAVKKLLNLRFGPCALSIAVPNTSPIREIYQLKDSTIATSYPISTRAFLDKNGISATIITLSGSVEIAPTLGIADAVCDLISTGSTLTVNDLRQIQTVYTSEAVLIANPKALKSADKTPLLSRLLMRFESVLSAKNYKYISMTAPNKYIRKINRLLSGIPSSTTITPISGDIASMQTVITEDRLWETVEKIQSLGVSKIIVTPVENIISKGGI